MTTPQPRTDRRRFRLATNDNETVVEDQTDDVEAHRLAGNDNEIVIDDAGSPDPDAADDEGKLGMRRARR
jgi:hypothetical protein